MRKSELKELLAEARKDAREQRELRIVADTQVGIMWKTIERWADAEDAAAELRRIIGR